jgi:hypothetical protein
VAVRDPVRLLKVQVELERTFAAEEATAGREPKGWPPSLIFFHLARWRERLRGGLTALASGQQIDFPSTVDEINDAELPSGRGLSLEETSAQASAGLAALIELGESLGDRPFTWGLARTTGEALVRNSYFHPRVHFAEYWHENGDKDRGHRLIEDTAAELRELWPAPVTLGAALYNLAAVRAGEGRLDEAMALLEEAAPMRPDLMAAAAADSDFASLKTEPRFARIFGSA